MATPTDTTPLLGGIGLARGDGRVRAAVAACCALAVAACVVYLGARERASGLLSQWYSDVVNVCPPVPPRAWSEMPEEGSAHMLLLGDSTDKLWIIEMCSDILPPEQQCRYIGADKRALDKTKFPIVACLVSSASRVVMIRDFDSSTHGLFC